MWAPADLFTPTVNAITLALKRAITLVWDNLLLFLIVVVVVIAVVVVFGSLRRRPRS